MFPLFFTLKEVAVTSPVISASVAFTCPLESTVNGAELISPLGSTLPAQIRIP
jgi:hypothetical protein